VLFSTSKKQRERERERKRTIRTRREPRIFRNEISRNVRAARYNDALRLDKKDVVVNWRNEHHVGTRKRAAENGRKCIRECDPVLFFIYRQYYPFPIKARRKAISPFFSLDAPFLEHKHGDFPRQLSLVSLRDKTAKLGTSI